MKTNFCRTLFLLFSFLNVKLYAGVGLSWAHNDSGPTVWPSSFEMCNSGTKQSPIDIRTEIVSPLASQIGYPDKLDFNPGPSRVRVLNDGHSIKIEYLEEYVMRFGLKEYHLKQLHFHHLSETTIDGVHSPLEGHFVHMSINGDILVVGVLLESSQIPSKLLNLFQHIAKQEKQKSIAWLFDASDILPLNMDYFNFAGSLTTPPCNESVEWIILKEKAKVSYETTDFFEDNFFFANYRQIQNLNERIIANFH